MPLARYFLLVGGALLLVLLIAGACLPSPPVIERVEAQRAAFRRKVSGLDRERFVFTDETGFHLAMTRLYGRAKPGQRVIGKVPRNQGTGVSLIGSLGLRGWVTTMSLPGSVDAMVFDSFLTELPVPNLRRGDIVLLDNLPAHQASQVEAIIKEIKARVLWLPSYSPDFSPIENCWSKVKTLVRGRQPRTANELDAALKEALNAVTIDDIEGWFKHCGY